MLQGCFQVLRFRKMCFVLPIRLNPAILQHPSGNGWVGRVDPLYHGSFTYVWCSQNALTPTVLRSSNRETPEASALPILSHMSRPRLATGCYSRQLLRAGGADIAGGRRWDASGEFAGLRSGRAGARMLFSLSYPPRRTKPSNWRAFTHVVLACQADFMRCKPTQGVDEGWLIQRDAVKPGLDPASTSDSMNARKGAARRTRPPLVLHHKRGLRTIMSMKSYIHRGVVEKNGCVDHSQSIADASKLEVLPSDDGFRLRSSEVGNFEWWYFDIIDAKNDYTLKIVGHLGTNPLKTRFFPTLAITVKTPMINKWWLTDYSLDNFRACRDYCDVKIGDDFHAFVDPSDDYSSYRVLVTTKEFSASLTFVSEVEGWKPLGDEVKIEKNKKQGDFTWIIPVPRARVSGEFACFGETYTINDALGYHDHNYWQVGNNKLFMDDVISHWYWGRFLHNDYTIIFMDTFFKAYDIRSCMIARGSNIVYSSNNLVEVSVNQFSEDCEIQSIYPSIISVKSIEEENSFEMIIQEKQIIDKRDLLADVNPILRRIIKLLLSKPSYHGILANATVNMPNEEVVGLALYESMCFRSTLLKRRGVNGIRSR
jgi:hypothetical protein